MPALMERSAATAFTERADDSAIQVVGTSVYTLHTCEYPERTDLAAEAFWVRWYVAVLLRESERLSQDLHQMNREIPRLREFSEKLQESLRSTANQKRAQRQFLAELIRSSSMPSIYIQEVLRQSATSGAPDRLDAGIDMLAQFDAPLIDVFESFLKNDRARWTSASDANHVNDDVCYVLLRALARSGVSPVEKMKLMDECLRTGTRSIREAAVHALGDMGGDAAKKRLRKIIADNSDALVRESAREALEDLDV